MGYDLENLSKVKEKVMDTVVNIVYVKGIPSPESWSTETIISVVGIGLTLLAILVALFGKEFMNWWNRINLAIIVPSESLINNTIKINDNSINVYECILELNDKKGKSLIKNAKVKLKSYSWKEDEKVEYRNIYGETLLPFITNNKNKTVISFLKQQEFILGYFEEYNNSIDFIQRAEITNNFTQVQKYSIKYNIYELEIISDNYYNGNKYYIQVYYNRGKVGTLRELIKEVNIQVVNNLEDFREVKVIDDILLDTKNPPLGSD